MSTCDRVENVLRKRVEKWALSHADLVITLTQRLRSFYLENRILPADKVVRIPDCIDADGFSSLCKDGSKDIIAKRFQIPQDKKIITYVGRVAIEKGWKYFVEMAQEFIENDVHFVICGDGNQRVKLEKTIDDKKMRARFTVTGFIPIEDVVGILKLSDMLVIPSIHEEFGSVALEAMAVGCPKVATTVGGISEVIRHEKNGLLASPRSPRELAVNGQRILDDITIREKLAVEGYEVVRNQYNLGCQMAKLVAAYHELVT